LEGQGAAPARSPNDITHAVIKAPLKMHSSLGPGLLESAYEACLPHELKKGALSVASQVPTPIVYDSVKLDVGYRLDLVVEDTVIMEICLPWTNGPATPMAARRFSGRNRATRSTRRRLSIRVLLQCRRMEFFRCATARRLSPRRSLCRSAELGIV
jgi:hypothetical protein